jgi:hypothetical protein
VGDGELEEKPDDKPEEKPDDKPEEKPDNPVCDCWTDPDGDMICDKCGAGGLIPPISIIA